MFHLLFFTYSSTNSKFVMGFAVPTNLITSPCFTRSLKPGNCHVCAKNPQCQTKNVAHMILNTEFLITTGLGYWCCLVTACLSQKSALACSYLCFILSSNTEFVITAGLVYWATACLSILISVSLRIILFNMCDSGVTIWLYIYKHI